MAIKSKMTDLTPGRQKYKQRIKLISGGYAAPAAFPNGEITVYPWDSSVDRWLAERARGPESVYDLVPQLADLNGCPLDKFVLGDVSTILLVSRAIARQNIIEVRPICPHCRKSQGMDKVNVPDELEKLGEKQADFCGWDQIVLPVCGDEVKIRPLIVGDERGIVARSENQKRDVSDILARTLAAVVSINDTTPDNLTELVQWWMALHARDQEFIASEEDRLYPHLNTDLAYTCDGCAKDFKHRMALDQEFFR